jgi:NAD(P)-dependent dehydrogenase (short-subunit alcohol dehydrogenase family)
MDINGSVALVTGGASGLGLATTEKLLDAGASVVILDLRNSEAVDKLGDRVRFVAGDVTSEDSVKEALDVAAELGTLRVAVNCAGTGNAIKTIGRKGPFPLADFNRIIQINLVGWPRSASLRRTRSTASAASSSTPRRSRRSTGRSGRRPTRRRRAASWA